jgi:hypothetical protein
MGTDHDYILAEMTHLRAVYDKLISETVSLERYALWTTGATWAWCIANPSAPAIDAVVWFPALSTLLFGLRAWGHSRQARAICRYVGELQAKLDLADGIGWEREGLVASARMRSVTGFAFWLVLQPATFAIAHYVSTRL